MLRFHVTNKREEQHFDHMGGPIEFGRGPQRGAVPRCVIQDAFISRDHVLIEEADGGVRVDNLSARNSIRVSDNTAIATGVRRDLRPPVRLTVGETVIDVELLPEDKTGDGPLETIASPASLAVKAKAGNVAQHSLLELGRTPTPETLAHWFETVIAVQRSAAGSPEFYAQTARAVVSLVGLDRGLVILKKAGRWMVQARCPEDGDTLGREFSLTIVDRVQKDRRTFFQSQASAASTSESLQGVEAVVASPIFDNRDQVVGAVYGCRSRFTAHLGLGIGPLEAQVMQLLASAVGVGLARQEQEAEAGRLRVQFEQFFSADLARELQRNPRLLEGQEREVTVLFSDIRGFSRLSERLGPTDTCKLVADVMDALTGHIRDFDGVVVDYSGDGIMAMWNAPASQPDHAAKAAPRRPGHASRPAGDRRPLARPPGHAPAPGDRPEYRPGPVRQHRQQAKVQVRSARPRGQPRQPGRGGDQALQHSAARHRLDTRPARRHLRGAPAVQGARRRHRRGRGTVRVGRGGHLPDWQAKCQAYEEGLTHYEAGNFIASCRALYTLLSDEKGHQDVPTLNLLARALGCIKFKPENFDGVLDLESK